ncbi:hypothetical protein [Selenomonas sp. FC4001]|uniref:hypothetical protein n=1 Tax=Selenomonas sp. FC4001 TaxID=1408313 RepID=UPI00056372B3|nr:hypothetical protein [Selenomonas sp. FC4001]
MRIIYLFERRLPYTGDGIKFGYDIMMSHGWQIEVWCLIGMNPDINIKKVSKNIRLDEADYVKYINTQEEFIDHVEHLDYTKTFFLCYPYEGYSKTSYFIRKELHKRRLQFANITYSPGMSYALLKKLPFSFILSVRQFIRRYFLGSFYFFFKWLKSRFTDSVSKNNLVDCWYRIIGPLLYPSYCNFVTTELAYYSMPQPFSKWLENNILVHTITYSEYLREDNISRYNNSKKYIVFLDQGLINRDEIFLATGYELPIKDSKAYVSDLCNLFSKLEQKYGCPVVVAAHPKSSYENGMFGNREIILGKTPELIRNAELVINQYSAAFFLAILYKKNFIDIYTKEMWLTPRKSYKDCYNSFKLLKCKLLDISDREAVNNFEDYIFRYNEETYKKIENIAIIDNNSKYRDKDFYEYVYDFIKKNEVT